MAKQNTPKATSGPWKRPSGTSTDSGIPSTGSFPTMGNGPASAVNASGAASRNTVPVAEKSTGGGMLEGATQARRTPIINEPNGPQHRITATAYAPTTNPEAGMNYRNVRLVPSSLGNRDFWDKRNQGV